MKVSDQVKRDLEFTKMQKDFADRFFKSFGTELLVFGVKSLNQSVGVQDQHVPDLQLHLVVVIGQIGRNQF